MKPLPFFYSFFSLMKFQLSLMPEGLIARLHNRLLPQLFCLEASSLTTLASNNFQPKLCWPLELVLQV